MIQRIRFCQGSGGARLAYAVSGEGVPLVRTPQWFTHLEHEPRNPIWWPWLQALSHDRTLIRTDERGSGLSDWKVEDISFDSVVADVEAVVNAAGLAQFSLLGHGSGGAIAVAYAAHHPERVTHLVLLNAYARGWLKRGHGPEVEEELAARVKLMELGLHRDDPTYRLMFASQYLPGAAPDELRAMSELLRHWATAQNGKRLMRCHYEADVAEAARRVRCPALVLHSRGDLRVPFEEGCTLASLIPAARFVPLDSQNHLLLRKEPAFAQFFAELRAFLPGTERRARRGRLAELTPRELEILERVARALDNAEIAFELKLSEKTVRNNITRIFDKLGVRTRAQAIVLAREDGLGER